MKKLPILFTLLLAFTNATYGQEKISKVSIQVQAGPSIPLGRFAHKSFSGSPHDTSGNARTGLAASVVLQYQVTKHWGASLTIGGSVNPQDEQYLEDQIRKGLTSDYIVQVEAKSWKAFKLMPGIYYSLPFSGSSKFSIKPTFSAGICKTSLPGFKYAYHNFNLQGARGALEIDKQKLPVSFCYQLSLTFDYAVSKKVFLLLDANYFGAKPTLKYSHNPNWPDVGNFVSAKKHYSLASFNMLVGAGVRF